MSDEAMEAALGSSKDYTLKQYLVFADRLQDKAKELSSGEDSFTPSDVERVLWSSAISAKVQTLQSDFKSKPGTRSTQRKRKR